MINLMHATLQGIASRLLLYELNQVARKLKADRRFYRGHL